MLKIRFIHKRSLAAAIVYAGLLPGMQAPAFAEAYLGINAGSTSYTVDLSNLDGGSFDDSATGTKFYGGYSFNDYFALEAAYYNFAEASVGEAELEPGGNVLSMASSAKGFAGYAVAQYPVGKKVNLMVKLGMLRWDADLEVNNLTTGTGGSGTSSGTDVAYGIAASYAFTRQLLIVGEWEGFNSDNPELSLFSVGFRFNFK